MQNRFKSVYDGNLLRREYYNVNSFPVFFERMLDRDLYVQNSGISLGPLTARLEAKGRIVLNHGYYKVFAREESLFDLVTIYGKHIGKGLTKPMPMSAVR